jgi:hypothetical protein
MSRKVWTALAGMILGGTAHAAVISTGLGLGGGECNVANVGTKPVTVKSVTIINGEGTGIVPTSNNCTFPGPISPGLDCSITFGPSSGTNLSNRFRCAIDTSSKSSIRATMMYLQPSGIFILEAH